MIKRKIIKKLISGDNNFREAYTKHLHTYIDIARSLDIDIIKESYLIASALKMLSVNVLIRR